MIAKFVLNAKRQESTSMIGPKIAKNVQNAEK